ncbi:Motility protein A [Fundidesulfovibrio magnetotacticus]|uniref:Motility protein A n=1 Tax=Fundidesulfovibrio magnetotacticus TaxID=2730080 RepID=A0A6V8LVH0_9BACT|nr:flagellar motor stator protein MotA [Fundidesulfovibrio magnetotacticus]GFK93667.1 Motility protein A [Fundidesulfovibrio magnetotacticus]
MNAIIGFVVVLGSVIGGYVLSHGKLFVLFQPYEFLTIGGAALGSFLIASPMSVVKDVFKHLPQVFTAKEDSKDFYMELLSLMYELFQMARRSGAVALDAHVNRPTDSDVFRRFGNVSKNKTVLNFICDNLKIVIAGNIEQHHYEAIMDTDISTRKHHDTLAGSAVTKIADALPGLGIVAAVLGIVITMGDINQPPEVLGNHIGAALVGTFLGVLMCYGFIGPMATNLEHQAEAKAARLKVVKSALMGYSIGLAPILAVEYARRAIPSNVQPSMEELEEGMKKG